MESKSWTVVFDGKLDSEQTPQKVKKNLAQLFKVSAVKIEPLFASPSVIIKKTLTHTVPVCVHPIHRFNIASAIHKSFYTKTIRSHRWPHLRLKPVC